MMGICSHICETFQWNTKVFGLKLMSTAMPLVLRLNHLPWYGIRYDIVSSSWQARAREIDGTHRNEIGDAQFIFRLALFDSHIYLSAEVGVHIEYYSLCSTMCIVRIPTVLLYINDENIRCSFRCASSSRSVCTCEIASSIQLVRLAFVFPAVVVKVFMKTRTRET